MATLTVTEILKDVIDAIRVRTRPLDYFTNGVMSAQEGGYRKGQMAICHVRKQPTLQDHSPQTGYANGATEGNTLFEDVPITLGNHKHVPIKLSYLNMIADSKQEYGQAIDDCAEVLGKGIVDDVLSDVLADNLSLFETQSTDNSDFDMLTNVQNQMNESGAGSGGRFGIVNTKVAGTLQSDSRIASNEFYGQRNGARAYREFTNIAGFEGVVEYPDMPGNDENLTGFFGDPRTVIVASAMPSHNQALAKELGIPSQGRFFPITSPDSNINLLGIVWEQPGTFDLYLTVTALWGKSVGKQGAAAGAKTDFAGCRLVSQ